jgi:hypothetical protein
MNPWPEFLIDRAGIIREFTRRRNYGKEEKLLRTFSSEGHPGSTIRRSRPVAKAVELADDVDGRRHLLADRLHREVDASHEHEGFEPGQTVNYRPTEKRLIQGFFAEGSWTNRPDDFEAAEDPRPDRPITLGVSYRGRDVYAVLDRATRAPVSVEVTRDGKPVPDGQRGKDVQALADGYTVTVIDEPRMYSLITNEDDSRTHEIVLQPSQKGVRISSFAFGNRCLEEGANRPASGNDSPPR